MRRTRATEGPGKGAPTSPRAAVRWLRRSGIWILRIVLLLMIGLNLLGSIAMWKEDIRGAVYFLGTGVFLLFALSQLDRLFARETYVELLVSIATLGRELRDGWQAIAAEYRAQMARQAVGPTRRPLHHRTANGTRRIHRSNARRERCGKGRPPHATLSRQAPTARGFDYPLTSGGPPPQSGATDVPPTYAARKASVP